MTVWSNTSTIFRYRIDLRVVMQCFGILLLIVALITTLFFNATAHAQSSVARTVAFHGRLLDTAGKAVPDGFYNIQFRIYEGGSGAQRNNPDGEHVWTETYVNDNDNKGIEVKNGLLSVNLGSVTPFGTLVDWNNDTLWLSMNIAGASATCTTFNSGSCTADGEMLPMKQLTSSPYAINSGMVGGKSADQLVQLGQGAQEDASDDLSSILINKTGSGGDFIRLQNNGIDVFSLDKNGDITLGTGDTTIKANDNTEPDGSGGNVSLQGGHATLGDANGGNIIISGGSGSGTGSNGVVIIDTPTFKTANQQNCDEDCTVNQSSIDGNGAIILNAENEDLTISLADPGNTTAGRVIYVSAANESNRFTLSLNDEETLKQISLSSNETATLFWNGQDWSVSSGGSNTQAPTQDDAPLVKLSQESSAPTGTEEELLGSMYYDTTLGKIQCYEVTGWGACVSNPDTFVSLTPEYSGAVAHGSQLGTLTTGFCSDSLAINNGTSAQPEICGSDETHNFYNWTSPELSAQAKSLYVTYNLPETFKEFVSGSVSLGGRTDSPYSSLNYIAYKKTSTGLIACGAVTTVSSGSESTWQKASLSGLADPHSCSFSAGDSIVFKIEATASQDSNVYIGDLRFAFSNS